MEFTIKGDLQLVQVLHLLLRIVQEATHENLISTVGPQWAPTPPPFCNANLKYLLFLLKLFSEQWQPTFYY